VDADLRFGGCQTTKFRVHDPHPIVKADFRPLFGEDLNNPQTVLGVTHGHAEMQRLNIHGVEFLLNKR
jgi:hypothetical protein